LRGLLLHELTSAPCLALLQQLQKATRSPPHQRVAAFLLRNAAATKVQRCFTFAAPVRQFCSSFGNNENVAIPTVSDTLFQLFHIFTHTYGRDRWILHNITNTSQIAIKRKATDGDVPSTDNGRGSLVNDSSADIISESNEKSNYTAILQNLHRKLMKKRRREKANGFPLRGALRKGGAPDFGLNLYFGE